ncbi:MAG: hypothetical protein NZ879_07710 [Archaeoglobaceae archaeon]|nr:hypothetical protein [Archaeoglobaceae archaeon]MDW8118851.1 hypothetical protein [Archaeoglobaceae archaeon]
MDLVIGGGKFGLKAVEYLIERRREFLILDPNPECEVVRVLNVPVLKVGAEKIIEVVEKTNPEWIFPTAPVHVVAEALKDLFEPWDEVIDDLLPKIPSKVVVSVGKGSVVLSYNRDGICIENCNSPEICPVTKLKKDLPMFELIKFAFPKALILISYQIAPGLGAIKGSEFIEVIEKAKKLDKVVVATACNCHGVITGMKKKY